MGILQVNEAGWLEGPFVQHIPGPADKVYSEPNQVIGLACHSIVGQEREFEDGIPARFLSQDRNPDGSYTAYAAASCQIILRKYETLTPGYTDLIQMYPFTASTWTSGGRYANTHYATVEMEGGLISNPSEPMTPPMVASFVELCRALEEWKPGLKLQPGANVLEHRHIAQMYGYAATACASGRYKLGWEALLAKEDDDMPDPEARAQLAIINDATVIQRDLLRTISQPHPAPWRIHKALRDAGLLAAAEYKGDYRDYA